MDWRDVARSQAGAISRAQLLGCGLTDSQARGLVSRRDVVRLLPGVYSPRPVPDSFDQRAWAAALWSGGVVSHRSAAQLWNLPAPTAATIHVTVADTRFRERVSGVRLHRVPLTSRGVTTMDGLALTNRVTTVLDLLRTERYGGGRDLFDRAIQQGWIDTEAVVHALRDGPGRAGNVALRRLLAESEPGAHAESERVLHRILKTGGFSGWVAQYRIRLAAGFAYVDVAFPQAGLIIEVDGRRYHDAASGNFERDRTRQNELIALGWRVLRFTWRMLIEEPARVRADIATLLGPIVQGFAP
jgi:very-short-patch-repair endonuclease